MNDPASSLFLLKFCENHIQHFILSSAAKRAAAMNGKSSTAVRTTYWMLYFLSSKYIN
jgi:hypothetical protein